MILPAISACVEFKATGKFNDEIQTFNLYSVESTNFKETNEKALPEHIQGLMAQLFPVVDVSQESLTSWCGKQQQLPRYVVMKNVTINRYQPTSSNNDVMEVGNVALGFAPNSVTTCWTPKWCMEQVAEGSYDVTLLGQPQKSGETYNFQIFGLINPNPVIRPKPIETEETTSQGW